MLKPNPVICQHQHAAQYEQWIRQLHDGKMPQITGVNSMRCDGQGGQGKGKLVYQPEERLYADDEVDEIAQETGREH